LLKTAPAHGGKNRGRFVEPAASSQTWFLSLPVPSGLNAGGCLTCVVSGSLQFRAHTVLRFAFQDPATAVKGLRPVVGSRPLRRWPPAILEFRLFTEPPSLYLLPEVAPGIGLRPSNSGRARQSPLASREGSPLPKALWHYATASFQFHIGDRLVFARPIGIVQNSPADVGSLRRPVSVQHNFLKLP